MNADLTLSHTSMRRLPIFRALADRHAMWWRAALASLALLMFCAGISLFDERTINGISVWSKPFKFSLSLAVYFATLAWFAPLMPNGYFQTRKGRLLTWIAIGCALFEMVYIVLQASRGEASHFNLTTPFYSVMYSLMGAGAVMLVTVCLWMGVVILREHGTRDPFVLAVGVGLILTFVLGGGFGGYLGSHMGHWVGGTQSDANGLWLLRWSRDGGDLRVAHFFGMHAMQVLPAIAAMLPATLSRRRAIGVVVGAAGVYAIATTFTFVQAVLGVSFI